MMNRLSVFGEQSLHLVAASFANGQAAEHAAAALARETDRVDVLKPHDPQAAVKLEPEQAGIWRTLVRAHVVLGVAGAVAGALAALLWMGASPAAADSPGYTLLFLAVMGGFFGLMAGGLLTLRPDHDLVIQRVHQALDHHRWAVVVHPTSEPRTRRACDTLRAAGAQPLRSL